MLRFSGAGVSDVGSVREHNEDSAFVAPYVALVADGVGGAAAGEVASATAAYVASAVALSRFGDDLERVLRDAVAAARTSLRQGVEQVRSREGMATTLTMILSDGQRILLGHIGDSRAYRLRDGAVTQLSQDHTYVQTLIDAGLARSEDLVHHPWRSVVLRSVHGAPDADLTDIDIVEVDGRPGDRLLLCSDGLTDLVDDDRITDVLRLKDPHSAAAVLTQAALEAGGRDNITCVVVDVVDGPLVVGDGRLVGAVADIDNIVDPAYVKGA